MWEIRVYSLLLRHLEPPSGPTRKAQDKGLQLSEVSVQELKGSR